MTSHLVNQVELEKFFADIGSRVAIAEKEQQQRDCKEATRFNVFDLIDPDENKLPDVLADLLDPKGNHGQGDLFLRLLLKQLDLCSDAKLTQDATVRREVPTHGSLKYRRRIDVLVEAGILLAIENKVDSTDQPEQIKDYLDHLDYCTQVRRAPSMLIYLTPDGRSPESIGPEAVDQQVARKKLCCWSYGRHLRAWLEECRSQCEAPRIRYFLSDFVRYIELVLNQETENKSKNPMSTKPIQECIIQSEENLRIGVAVAETWPEARRQLMSSFLNRLQTQLMKKLNGWEPWRDSDFLKEGAGYYITKREWRESYWIGFDCWYDWSKIYIGISWETVKPRKEAVAELLTALRMKYPSAKYNSGWPWVFAQLRSPEPDWSEPDVLWRMQDPEFITDVADQLLKIVEVSEHIIDRLVKKR